MGILSAGGKRLLRGQRLYHGSPRRDLTTLRQPWLTESEGNAWSYAGPDGRVYTVDIDGDFVPITQLADSYFEHAGAPSMREALRRLNARGFHDVPIVSNYRLYEDIVL